MAEELSKREAAAEGKGGGGGGGIDSGGGSVASLGSPSDLRCSWVANKHTLRDASRPAHGPGPEARHGGGRAAGCGEGAEQRWVWWVYESGCVGECTHLCYKTKAWRSGTAGMRSGTGWRIPWSGV